MLTKEKFLKDKISLHIKSPESNEEYVKLIQRLIDLGWKTYNNTSAENFSQYTWIYLPHIDEEYLEIHPRMNPDGYKELQISDILGENNQFEVGKWYKILNKWWGKFETIHNSGKRIKFSETITSNGKYINASNYIDFISEVELLTDLSEIQQYLPDGHVDKLPKKFVLPEKWCVKSTKDTIKVLNDFIKSKGYGSTLSNNYYIHYPFANGSGSAFNDIRNGYTEITFDQFKQHVLKESVEEDKTIEKWGIGSYVVALENYTLSKNILKGDMRKINEPDINNNKIFGELIVNSWQEDIILPKWKWFPTLAEAEAFSKSLLEPKPLTVDDLVEGEIYYCLNNTICLWGKKDSTHSINFKCEDFWNAEPGRYTNEYGFRLTTPEERKWLLTCIKQDKFISQDQLDKYDSEGNLIEVISKPETKESKQMQLSDLKNPVFNIGDKVRVIADSLRELNSSWINGNNAKYKKGYEGLIINIAKYKSDYDEVNTWYYLSGDDLNAISCNLLELVEPAKKEFDRNWYVEVNSQEEADKVFDWLETQNEKIGEKYYRKFRKGIDKYLYYFNEGKFWAVNSSSKILFSELKQKQLSDIISNNSSEPKVDRNVYYEVSNQKQYEEILDWLESKGEKVNRCYKVIYLWYYVYFRKDNNCWELYDFKPNLPKAEFQFKSKQSIKVNTYFEEACPFPSFGGFSVDLSCFNTFISGQFICPTIEETPTNEKVKVQLINVPRI